MSNRAEEILIDHTKLIDGFEELTEHRYYFPFQTFCGTCDRLFELSPRVQKYMLEVRGIPVKMLQRGAVYCVKCRRRRSRINYLKSGDKWRAAPGGKEEINDLIREERNLKRIARISGGVAAGEARPVSRNAVKVTGGER